MRTGSTSRNSKTNHLFSPGIPESSGVLWGLPGEDNDRFGLDGWIGGLWCWLIQHRLCYRPSGHDMEARGLQETRGVMMDIDDLVQHYIGVFAPDYQAASHERRSAIVRHYDDLLDLAYRAQPDKRIAYMKLFFHNACPYMKRD